MSAILSRDYEMLRRLVRERSGIELGADKQYLAECRMVPLMRDRGLATITELLRQVRDDQTDSVADEVVDAMTTNETSFFRDAMPFERLRLEVLPDLIRRRARTRRLRIWCAACSSGQEPYSIAMLLREHFPTLRGWQIEILGTDLSPRMIRRATQGIYSTVEVNRGLPARSLVRWFSEREHGRWAIAPELRTLCRFERLNLTRPFPRAEPWDIVFLRNVLIYFDRPTREDVLTRTGMALADDGWLFLGATESPGGLGQRLSQAAAGVYGPRVTEAA